jgi:ribosomal protein S18 acetylase RimI-like enzyme
MRDNSMDIKISELKDDDIPEALRITEQLLGTYLSPADYMEYYEKSLKDKTRNSLVATIGSRIIGFSVMYAPGRWAPDEFCTVTKWSKSPELCAYYKVACIIPEFQNHGVAGMLSRMAIEIARKQGAHAIIAHVWLNSPNNASLRLVERLGGMTIGVHKKRWYRESVEKGWRCSRCGNPCACDAAEVEIKLDRPR